MITETTTRRTARTPEGKLRQRVHALRRQLNLSEPAYRNILLCIGGSRWARDLNQTELEVTVAFLEREVSNKRPVYAPVSDEEALDVLGLAA